MEDVHSGAGLNTPRNGAAHTRPAGKTKGKPAGFNAGILKLEAAV